MKHTTIGLLVAAGVLGAASDAYATGYICRWVETKYQCGSDTFCTDYKRECIEGPDYGPDGQGNPQGDAPCGGSGGYACPDRQSQCKASCSPGDYTCVDRCACTACQGNQDGCKDAARFDDDVCRDSARTFAMEQCWKGIGADWKPTKNADYMYCPSDCDPATNYWCVGQPCTLVKVATAECMNGWMYGIEGSTVTQNFEISGGVDILSGKAGGSRTYTFEASKGFERMCGESFTSRYFKCDQGENSCYSVCPH